MSLTIVLIYASAHLFSTSVSILSLNFLIKVISFNLQISKTWTSQDLLDFNLIVMVNQIWCITIMSKRRNLYIMRIRADKVWLISIQRFSSYVGSKKSINFIPSYLSLYFPLPFSVNGVYQIILWWFLLRLISLWNVILGLLLFLWGKSFDSVLLILVIILSFVCIWVECLFLGLFHTLFTYVRILLLLVWKLLAFLWIVIISLVSIEFSLGLFVLFWLLGGIFMILILKCRDFRFVVIRMFLRFLWLLVTLIILELLIWLLDVFWLL